MDFWVIFCFGGESLALLIQILALAMAFLISFGEISKWNIEIIWEWVFKLLNCLPKTSLRLQFSSGAHEIYG